MVAKVIVFDFDGTIADTYDALVEITNELSGEFGYKPVQKSEVLKLKNLSSREIVKQSEISLFKIPFLFKRVKTELSKQIGNLKPLLGINDYLRELQDLGYKLGIITSNSQENVELFLKNNQLEDIFDFIYSANSLFGKHKTIKQFLQKNNLDSEEVIYVGDETRDIEAAKKSNVKVIAVSWGFNSASALAEYKPDFLIDQPQELIEVIASLCSCSLAIKC